eukprot:g1892.t1
MISVRYVSTAPRYNRVRRYCPVVSAPRSSLLNKWFNYSDEISSAKSGVEVGYTCKANSNLISTTNAPWVYRQQRGEKNGTLTDESWIDEVKEMVAEEMQLTDEEFEQRLSLVLNLLPGLESQLTYISNNTIAQLITNAYSLCEKIVTFKSHFPEVSTYLYCPLISPQIDAVSFVQDVLHLFVSMSLEEIQEAADRLHDLFPNSNVDCLLQEYPGMFDIENFETAIEFSEYECDFLSVEETMHNNPELILDHMY